MKIVAISNQKGGVGKTTTAVHLTAGLAARGVPTLLVDLDQQGNATSALGLEQEEGSSLYGPLTGDGDAASKIKDTGRENLHIIPSHMELAGCEKDLAQGENHLDLLREILQPIADQGDYEYAILDTPPSLGLIMTSALAAADEILIPLQCEYFGLEGLAKIVHVIESMRNSGANPDVQIEGIVMTMFDGRTNLARQVVADVRQHFSETVYETIIPRSVRLGEAPGFGQTAYEYDGSGSGSKAYAKLTDEFLQRREEAAQKN